MISSPAQPRVLSGDHVELEFKKVSFAYETRPEIQVLSEIDFLVGSGEIGCHRWSIRGGEEAQSSI